MNTHRKSIPWAGATAAMLAALLTTAQATLINGSFESPEVPESQPSESTPTSWGFFSESGFDTSGVVEDAGVARTGDQMLQFFANASAGVDVGFQGYFQTYPIVLQTGQQIGFEAWLRSSSALPMQPGVDARLGIEFRNSGSELNRVELTITSAQLSTSAWRPFVVYGSPAGITDEINVTLVQDKQLNSLSANSIFFVDDVAIVPEPSTLFLLVGGGWLIVRAARRNSNA